MPEQPRKVGFLSQKDCGYCQSARESYKNEIAAGQIEEVFFDTPRGRELAKKLKATGTPTFFVEDATGLKSCDHTVTQDGKVKFSCELPKQE